MLQQVFINLPVQGDRAEFRPIFQNSDLATLLPTASRCERFGDGGSPFLFSHSRAMLPAAMSTLQEIEAAAERLPTEQKQELLLFLAARLRAERGLPEPREFSQKQLDSWLAEDEADMRRLRDGK